MSLRDTLQRLEQQGDLVRVRREVDSKFELAAVAKKLDGGPAVLFERVRGHRMPVVIGVDGTKDRVAQNLGLRGVELIGHFGRAIGEPIPWKAVADGPVGARRLRAPFDLGQLLPVPHHYEKEPAPFITSGVVVARDPIQDVYDSITKIGIDATKPLARADRFELAKIPGYDTLDLRDYLLLEGAEGPSKPPRSRGE